MRNYIVLNGQSSNEIAGLLIQSLPAITKPKIRTQVEEIDGRDGDIITKLGYSAYNKEISIGLYGNYNVDDIIKYFTDNQSGKVTFSDEPDKYYNYEILDQVDFDKLIRYRTATVTLHCQPFKYSTTEEKIQIDATEVSGSGSNITLNNTEDGALFTSLKINGDTSQDTTTGKNLFISSTGTTTTSGMTFTKNNDGSWTLNGTNNSGNTYYLRLNDNFTLQAGTYTLSNSNPNVNNDTGVIFFDDGNNFTPRANIVTKTFTSAVTIKPYIKWNNNVSVSNFKIYPMIERGSNYTGFEPYTGTQPSPNPDYPQNVNVVTGDNTINIYGKNLLDLQNGTYIGAGITAIVNNGMITLNGTATQNSFINIPLNNNFSINGSFTISANNNFIVGTISNWAGIRLGNIDYDTIGGQSVFSRTNTSETFNVENKVAYYLTIRTASGLSYNNNVIYPQVELGTTATSYEPYVSQTYPVNLGDIELCKIGDYQDYIYKENGNWYKYSAIGKVVLNGSESWTIYNSGTQNWYYSNINSNIDIINDSTTTNSMSNYYQINAVGNSNTNQGMYIVKNSKQIRIRYGTEDTTTNFKNWLSTHNTLVYYVLATPTTTQITDTDLISQLEALAGATTYLGQTNIITSGLTLNPLLEVTTFAVDDPSFVITNSGNINSKPIITIYGLGTVGLYLNGIQVLSLDMGETTSQITIDVAKLEAYNQETGALMNRSVTGDYNNLSLNVGENTITESGTLQGIEVENYSRWL